MIGGSGIFCETYLNIVNYLIITAFITSFLILSKPEDLLFFSFAIEVCISLSFMTASMKLYVFVCLSFFKTWFNCSNLSSNLLFTEFIFLKSSCQVLGSIASSGSFEFSYSFFSEFTKFQYVLGSLLSKS